MAWDYDRKFGKFRYSVTGEDWFNQLEEDIYKSFYRKDLGDLYLGTESHRYRGKKEKLLHKWEKVYEAFKDYRKDVKPDEAVTWYHTLCLQDFDLYCLNHVRPDSGLPMFPTEWQSEFAKAIEEYDSAFSLDSRKIGKTCNLQGLAPYWMCNGREHVRLFAPTDDQLLVRTDVIDNIQTNDFLYEEFVIGTSDLRRKQGRVTLETVQFGRNGSTFFGTTLSQKGKAGGKSKVGAKGTRFLVDEWGLVEDRIFNTVILPMTADAFTRKKIAGFGTATLDVNPNMREIWQDYVDNPKIFTIMIPWTTGVRQGAIRREYMTDAFKKNHVPCQSGLRYGICIRDWVKDINVGIYEKTGKLVYPHEKDYPKSWKCDESCYLNKSFAEEHWAKFVRDRTEFWPMNLIRMSGKPDLDWWQHVPRGKTPFLVGAVDFGALMYPTQAGIGEVIDGKLILRKHLEIRPRSETRKNDPRIAYPIVKELHQFFDKFDPYIHQYYFDITGDKFGLLSEMLTKTTDGMKPFKRSKIYCNETLAAKNKERNTRLAGIWVSGEYNGNVLKENLRTQFLARNIEVPMREPFWSMYIHEFEHCIVEPTRGETYKTFIPPKGSHRRIDILDMMSFMALAIHNKSRRKPFMGVLQQKGRNISVPMVSKI